ncbi:MAG TPA: hypothetical protein VFG30_00050 [Polyangiales bacterium]|nr:hypothetical protein [Polyangiales bacterium]
MSQERVARLEALLSRVQENRKRTRTPAMGLVKPAEVVARAAPEPAPAKPVHTSLTQTSAGFGAMSPIQPAAAAPQPEPMRPVSPIARPAQPAAAAPAPVRSAPASPPKLQPQPAPRPAIAEAPAARAPAPAPEAARRPAPAASASPLEMAVAELDHPSSGVKPDARHDIPVATAAPLAPPISPEESFEPKLIEPEPMREPARPIAQVVSRHSPQVDATFGAMLKRSLSLRPH